MIALGGLGHGDPFDHYVQAVAERGYQAVPTQWHVRDGKPDQTPMPGVTGLKVPFLSPDELSRVIGSGYLRLHLQGGPDCTGPWVKPTIRPPENVTMLDVDHYDDKAGGDTLKAVQARLGPLPATWVITGRGAGQLPSGRHLYRHPSGLVIRDPFFTEHGGSIETVRTGHRYTWTAPAVHVKAGAVIGPVVCYGPDGRVCELPHVNDLPELPAAWVAAITEFNLRRPGSTGTGAYGEPSTITVENADDIVANAKARFDELGPPEWGGAFRTAVFGLAAVVARRTFAAGGDEADVREELDDLFTEHPDVLTPDDNDQRLIASGIEAAREEPWVFGEATLTSYERWELWGWDAEKIAARMKAQAQARQGLVAPPPASQQQPATWVSDDDLDEFLATFAAYKDPWRLGLRVRWARADGVYRLRWHASLIVQEVLQGRYPADRALEALSGLCDGFGIADPAYPLELLRAALSGILTYQKVCA